MLYIMFAGGKKTRKVLIADGHPAMRHEIRSFLDTPSLEVVGETGCGDETLRLARKLEPDLVVLGLNVTRPDGVEVCRELKSLPDAPYVLVHTAYNFARDISSCVAAGADSYLHKRTDRKFFREAALRTAAGERVWEVGEHVEEYRSIIDVTGNGHRLSPREIEVLAFKLRRYPNAGIAQKLGISVHTVKRHINAIYRKIPRTDLKELL